MNLFAYCGIDHPMGVTRREVLAMGIAGATALAAGEVESKSKTRLPVAFVPHGGGPWPFVDLGFGTKSETDQLAAYLKSVPSLTRTKPKALLVVSAHWEEAVPTVMTAARPPLLFDYYGFPPESYRLTWPAPGEPKVAARVRELLSAAGISSAEDSARGFDHGTFVPLKLSYPNAEIPTVQLSLKKGLDPKEHLAMGRALAPLRDEGVFIIGSGMSYHNMRGFGGGQEPQSEAFDRWLREGMVLEQSVRDQRLIEWTQAPSARAVHPREEHLLPLMVIAGAAGSDRGSLDYNGTFASVRLSGYSFG